MSDLIFDSNGICEITTPYLDRHNDHIQIYVEQKENNTYELHDDGYTISDLTDPSNLDETLKRFNVSEKDGILFVKADKNTFSHQRDALLQAMIVLLQK